MEMESQVDSKEASDLASSIVRNANCRYSAKAYFTDVFKWTDRQCDDSRRHLLLRSFNEIRPADQGTRRLMATLIHRDTVSTSILDHIRRSELQNGRIGELAERSLDRVVTGTKQEE